MGAVSVDAWLPVPPRCAATVPEAEVAGNPEVQGTPELEGPDLQCRP
eukprot:SAG11_NODE_1749_length_4320_cov_15.669983_6_plen_47_part_00